MSARRFHPSRLSTTLTTLALLSAATLSGCGGGGDADPAAGISTASGTIEGFGSIVVNGVRYDDSSARVFDADETSGSTGVLGLGMVVDVVAGPVQAGASGAPTAVATQVRYRSEVQGPLTAIAGDLLTVLGQSVRIGAATVFEEGRSATLQTGRVLEVYGLRDASGQITATRIDIEDDADEPYSLQAPIAALDTVARRFRIGDAEVLYGSATGVPAQLADGDVLRVRLSRTPDASGQWQATTVRAVSPLATTEAASGVKADLEGYITRVDSSSRFAIGQVTVDVSAAQRLPANLAVGSLVEVEGRWVDGVLQAREVELERRLDADAGFEIDARITALDSVAGTLALRGVTVDYRNARFEDGPATRLAVGVRVEVSGSLSSDGRTLVASVVDFD